MIPTFETERMILRAPRGPEFEAFARFYESDASRFVGGPQDRVGAWREGEAEFKPFGINPFYRHLPPAEFFANHSRRPA